MNVAVATRMPVESIALATAIHSRVHDASTRSAARHLDVTPRAHFQEALVWCDSNAATLKRLKSSPEAVAAGGYSLKPARGLMSRLFSFGRKKSTEVDDFEQLASELAERRKPVDPKRARKLADLRDLVDESFDSAE